LPLLKSSQIKLRTSIAAAATAQQMVAAAAAGVRVWAVSDLHTDYAENLAW